MTNHEQQTSVEHREMIRQMRIDTAINAVIALAAMGSFFAILLKYSKQ